MHHTNDGKCEMCQSIIDRYPGFDPKMRAWFEDFQSVSPEAHISCAGRGKADQEAAFSKGLSRAHYGESAHNYNAAMDFFCVLPGGTDIYNHGWFTHTLKPALKDFLIWYGEPKSSFFELPHVELIAWKDMVDQGFLTLVE